MEEVVLITCLWKQIRIYILQKDSISGLLSLFSVIVFSFFFFFVQKSVNNNCVLRGDCLFHLNLMLPSFLSSD